jgi:hypothetical protein
MKRNCRIPSLFRACPFHWVAIGCFEVDDSFKHRYELCSFTSNKSWISNPITLPNIPEDLKCTIAFILEISNLLCPTFYPRFFCP